MMATTMLPPATAPKPPTGDVRYVAVRANLMPDEVISARQADVVRKQVLVGLVVVAVVLVGWFALSWWQTKSANDSLHSAQQKAVALQSQQNEFAPLVTAQSEITNIQSRLGALMVHDLSWKKMLTKLRAAAPTGVTLTGVTGTVSSASPVPGAAPGAANGSVLNTTGSAAVGDLTLTGNAPDKRTVAAYADALAKVRGLAGPLVSNVTGSTRPLTFTITAVITSEALGGRYSAAVVTPTTTVPTTTGPTTTGPTTTGPTTTGGH